MNNDKPRHVAIVGGTSSIAEHCARIWAARGAQRITLVVRDAVRGERIAADLRVRQPAAHVEVVETSFTDPASIAALVGALSAADSVDLALIAHGSLPDQAACQEDLAACEDALRVNGVSPALFAEAFAGTMGRAGGGRLAIIGSVAGDRGRKSNYVYGSAKGLIDRYAQGLQHRFAATGVRVTLVKPGPTDTPMTAHLKESGGALADVEAVARAIVAGVDRGRALVYAPGKWALIMLVLRHLPRVVFHRLDI